MKLLAGERLTRNDGDRKFSMNQNLTVLFVLRRTLRIMMDANRYPDINAQYKNLK